MSKTRLCVLTALGLTVLAVAMMLTRHFVLDAQTGGPAEVNSGEPLTFGSSLSFSALQPGEQHVIKFLLLLPLGALIVSIFRTVIGVPTFGSFTPVLVGLAFMDLGSLHWSLGIFVATVMFGWVLRHVLDKFALLQVSRFSVLLTFIIMFLIAVITVGGRFGLKAEQLVGLFPLAILTHMAERFWTLDAEEGKKTAFKTLLGTLVVAVTIALVLNPQPLAGFLFHYPETLGLVLAAHLLLGRYTGYRISELIRFRDLLASVDAAEKQEKDTTVSV